jgi:hypothetical protein
LKESGNATFADKFDSWRASSKLPPELKYPSAFLCLYLFLQHNQQRAPQLGFRRLAFSSGHDLRLLEKRRINLDA